MPHGRCAAGVSRCHAGRGQDRWPAPLTAAHGADLRPADGRRADQVVAPLRLPVRQTAGGRAAALVAALRGLERAQQAQDRAHPGGARQAAAHQPCDHRPVAARRETQTLAARAQPHEETHRNADVGSAFSEWHRAAPRDGSGRSRGGSAQGEFAYIRCTQWTEMRACAQKWVFEQLLVVRRLLPFELLGVHSDNGGEFINAHLQRYCDSSRSLHASRAHRERQQLH